MDDFSFPVLLEDDDDLVMPADDDHEPQTTPFHLLVSCSTDKLPKTQPPQGASTIGGSIRDIVQSRTSWRTPQLVLPVRGGATPFSGAQDPSETPPPLDGDGEHIDGAPLPQEKYMWMPTRRVSAPWSDADTNTFYDGIAQFGSDFASIAVLLPGKTRRDVAHKYHVEQRKRPERIRQALLASNQRPVDFEKFAESKKRCEELAAEPVRELNEEEEAHMQAIDDELGTSERQPTASSSVSGGAAGASGMQSASNTSDFDFDQNEDVPMAELYTNKLRSSRSASKRTDTAAVPSSKPAKRPRAVSPSNKPPSGTSTGLAPAPATGKQMKKGGKRGKSQEPQEAGVTIANVDFEFEDGAPATAPQQVRHDLQVGEEGNDLVFDQDFDNGFDGDGDFGFL